MPMSASVRFMFRIVRRYDSIATYSARLDRRDRGIEDEEVVASVHHRRLRLIHNTNYTASPTWQVLSFVRVLFRQNVPDARCRGPAHIRRRRLRSGKAACCASLAQLTYDTGCE